MSGNEKFCVNCVHYTKSLFCVEPKCKRTRYFIVIDWVTGEKWLKESTCSYERDNELDGYCGLEARFYEEKESIFFSKLKKLVGWK